MKSAFPLILVAAGVSLAVPSAACAQQPIGFEAPLGAEGIAEPVAPECRLSKGTLSCALYGVDPPTGARCDAGGAVTELRLGAAGRAQREFVCVDEGFHDWGVLSADQVWRRSGYDCSHRWSGAGLGRIGRLSCSNVGGYEFSVDGLGRINTPAGPQRGWLALGDSYASGEGIPGTEPGHTAQGRDCRRATGNGTDAKAWSVGAYEEVRKKFGFGRIASVACTGAITDEIESQMEEATAGSGSGAWHMATLGIGGNNIRFSDVLLGCLDIPNHWDEFDLTPGCDADPVRLRTRIDMLTGKKTRKKGEYEGDLTLPQVLDQVAGVIHPGGDVFVSGYPQLVEEVSRWDRWRRTLIGNCEGILDQDVDGLRGVTAYLNEQIGQVVREADRRHKDEGVRFHFADVASDPYEYSDDPGARHALCTGTPWLNGQTIGITSGDLRLDRSFHPMQVGHTNTARVIARLMRDHVKFTDVPETPALTARTLLNYGDGDLRYKPRSLEIAGSGVACGVWKARDIKWQSWTRDEAAATGTLIYNPGEPDCASSELETTPATFRFFRPKRDCPIYRGSRTVHEPRTVFTRVDVEAAPQSGIETPWKTAPADGFQCR